VEFADLQAASNRWSMDASAILRNCFKVVAGRGFLDAEAKIEVQLKIIYRELKTHGRNLNQMTVLLREKGLMNGDIYHRIERYESSLLIALSKIDGLLSWTKRSASAMREDI